MHLDLWLHYEIMPIYCCMHKCHGRCCCCFFFLLLSCCCCCCCICMCIVLISWSTWENYGVETPSCESCLNTYSTRYTAIKLLTHSFHCDDAHKSALYRWKFMFNYESVKERNEKKKPTPNDQYKICNWLE